MRCLCSSKIPRKVQMRCTILRPKGGKNEVRGTRYKWNLVICKLINVKKLRWRLLDWRQFAWLKVVTVIESRGLHGGRRDWKFHGKTELFYCFAFFCISLYISPYKAMKLALTQSLSFHNFSSLINRQYVYTIINPDRNNSPFPVQLFRKLPHFSFILFSSSARIWASPTITKT